MAVNPMPALRAAFTRISRDQNGATATMVAIAFPALIGFGALGAETGAWFTIKLRNQSAADAAAISAAYEVMAGKTNIGSELTAAANEAAARNGYRGKTLTVSYPYSDTVISNAVAVTLKQTQARFLAALFLPSLTISTSAVAIIEALDKPCILALGKSGTDVEVASDTRLEMSGCSAVANSIGETAIELGDSSSSLAASTLVTAGEISLQGVPIDPAAPPLEFALASPAEIGAPEIADPYAGTLTHSLLITGMPTSGRCKSHMAAGVRVYDGLCVIPGSSLTQTSISLTANTQISGTWSILSGQTVNLAPGTYWVTGDLNLESNGVLKCSACNNAGGIGVTIILTTTGNKIGALSMAASASFNLNAPRSGRLAGVVIAQDSNGLPPGTSYTSSHSTIGGAATATLNGLVYFPNSSLRFHGAPSAADPKCLVLVVGAVSIDAASNLESGGCPTAGITNFPTISTVALAE